jgi:hypothetical protein
MAPDGADHELIEDNVVAGEVDGYPFAVTLWSDDGSVIRHNTFSDGACLYDIRCGVVSLGSKSGRPPGTGTVIEDNVMGKVSVPNGSASVARRSHNLLASGTPAGEGELRGVPTYTGGAAPSSYAGFRLAPGSLGVGAASDGLDIGARFGAPPVEPAAAQPGPVPVPGSGPGAGPGPVPAVTPAPAARRVTVRVRSTRRSVRRTGRLRLAVHAPEGRVALTVRAGRRTLRPVRLRFARERTRVVVLRVPRSARRGLRRVTVRARPGGTFRLRVPAT